MDTAVDKDMAQDDRTARRPKTRTRTPRRDAVDHTQLQDSLVAGYREMAHDSDREREAIEWIEGSIGDASAHG